MTSTPPREVDVQDLPAVWKCYGITTLDRPDRSARLRRELGRVGLPFVVTEGQRPRDDGGFENAGTYGCFSNHLASLRLARDEGVDVAIVVEDDAVVTRSFPRSLSAIIAQLDTLDWSMLYLGFLNSSPIRRSPLRRVTENVACCSGWEVTGSHFIAIPRAELDSVIANFEARLEPGGHRISPDGVYNEYRRDHDRDTFICLPNLARQGPSPSGITERTGLKPRLLQISWIRALAWPVKRWVWDLAALVPASYWERRWNRHVTSR
jgi:hypothetical protein